MTRKLPWKRDSASVAPPPPPSPAPRTPVALARRRVKAEPEDGEADAKGTPAPAPPSSKKPLDQPPRSHRFGSTSPPPGPLQESFMVEGLDGDDAFRMVEDELLAVAQQFTAHLHAAEYQRLKAAAAAQNAETVRQISRPVVGRQTDSVKRKRERAALLKTQKAARRRLGVKRDRNESSSGDSEDDGDLQPVNSSLYKLMASPRKKAPRLDGIPGLSLGARAALASRGTAAAHNSEPPPPLSFARRPPAPPVPNTDDDDDSDDLDAPARHLARGAASSISEQAARAKAGGPENRAVAADHGAARPSARPTHPARTQAPRRPSPARALPQRAAEPQDPSDDDDDDDDDPFSGIKSRMAQRLSRTRNPEKAPSNTRPAARDYMPGFL